MASQALTSIAEEAFSDFSTMARQASIFPAEEALFYLPVPTVAPQVLTTTAEEAFSDPSIIAPQALPAPAEEGAMLRTPKEKQLRETLLSCAELNGFLEPLHPKNRVAVRHLNHPSLFASTLPSSTPSTEPVMWLTPMDLLSPRFRFFPPDVRQRKAAMLSKWYTYLNSSNPFEEELKEAYEGISFCSSECLKAEMEFYASQQRESMATFEFDLQQPELQFPFINEWEVNGDQLIDPLLLQ